MSTKEPCKPSRHVLDKASIAHSGSGLLATCKRCGQKLTRKVGGWVPVPVQETAYEGVDRRAQVRGSYLDRTSK